MEKQKRARSSTKYSFVVVLLLIQLISSFVVGGDNDLDENAGNGGQYLELADEKSEPLEPSSSTSDDTRQWSASSVDSDATRDSTSDDVTSSDDVTEENQLSEGGTSNSDSLGNMLLKNLLMSPSFSASGFASLTPFRLDDDGRLIYTGEPRSRGGSDATRPRQQTDHENPSSMIRQRPVRKNTHLMKSANSEAIHRLEEKGNSKNFSSPVVVVGQVTKIDQQELPKTSNSTSLNRRRSSSSTLSRRRPAVIDDENPSSSKSGKPLRHRFDVEKVEETLLEWNGIHGKSRTKTSASADLTLFDTASSSAKKHGEPAAVTATTSKAVASSPNVVGSKSSNSSSEVTTSMSGTRSDDVRTTQNERISKEFAKNGLEFDAEEEEALDKLFEDHTQGLEPQLNSRQNDDQDAITDKKTRVNESTNDHLNDTVVPVLDFNSHLNRTTLPVAQLSNTDAVISSSAHQSSRQASLLKPLPTSTLYLGSTVLPMSQYNMAPQNGPQVRIPHKETQSMEPLTSTVSLVATPNSHLDLNSATLPASSNTSPHSFTDANTATESSHLSKPPFPTIYSFLVEDERLAVPVPGTSEGSELAAANTAMTSMESVMVNQSSEHPQRAVVSRQQAGSDDERGADQHRNIISPTTPGHETRTAASYEELDGNSETTNELTKSRGSTDVESSLSTKCNDAADHCSAAAEADAESDGGYADNMTIQDKKAVNVDAGSTMMTIIVGQFNTVLDGVTSHQHTTSPTDEVLPLNETNRQMNYKEDLDDVRDTIGVGAPSVVDVSASIQPTGVSSISAFEEERSTLGRTLTTFVETSESGHTANGTSAAQVVNGIFIVGDQSLLSLNASANIGDDGRVNEVTSTMKTLTIGTLEVKISSPTQVSMDPRAPREDMFARHWSPYESMLVGYDKHVVENSDVSGNVVSGRGASGSVAESPSKTIDVSKNDQPNGSMAPNGPVEQSNINVDPSDSKEQVNSATTSSSREENLLSIERDASTEVGKLAAAMMPEIDVEHSSVDVNGKEIRFRSIGQWTGGLSSHRQDPINSEAHLEAKESPPTDGRPELTLFPFVKKVFAYDAADIESSRLPSPFSKSTEEDSNLSESSHLTVDEQTRKQILVSENSPPTANDTQPNKTLAKVLAAQLIATQFSSAATEDEQNYVDDLFLETPKEPGVSSEQTQSTWQRGVEADLRTHEDENFNQLTTPSGSEMNPFFLNEITIDPPQSVQQFTGDFANVVQVLESQRKENYPPLLKSSPLKPDSTTTAEYLMTSAIQSTPESQIEIISSTAVDWKSLIHGGFDDKTFRLITQAEFETRASLSAKTTITSAGSGTSKPEPSVETKTFTSSVPTPMISTTPASVHIDTKNLKLREPSLETFIDALVTYLADGSTQMFESTAPSMQSSPPSTTESTTSTTGEEINTHVPWHRAMVNDIATNQPQDDRRQEVMTENRHTDGHADHGRRQLSASDVDPSPTRTSTATTPTEPDRKSFAITSDNTLDVSSVTAIIEHLTTDGFVITTMTSNPVRTDTDDVTSIRTPEISSGPNVDSNVVDRREPTGAGASVTAASLSVGGSLSSAHLSRSWLIGLISTAAVCVFIFVGVLSFLAVFFSWQRRSASYMLSQSLCRNPLGISAASAFIACRRQTRHHRHRHHHPNQQQQPTELSDSFEFRSRNAVRSPDRVIRLTNLSGGGGGVGVSVVTEMPFDVT